MKGLLDMVTQSSSISLGELNARTVGDVDATAKELAMLLSEGLIKVETTEMVSLTPKTEDLAGKVVEILNSPQANSYFAQPTARGFKLKSW